MDYTTLKTRDQVLSMHKAGEITNGLPALRAHDNMPVFLFLVEGGKVVTMVESLSTNKDPTELTQALDAVGIKLFRPTKEQMVEIMQARLPKN